MFRLDEKNRIDHRAPQAASVGKLQKAYMLQEQLLLYRALDWSLFKLWQLSWAIVRIF